METQEKLVEEFRREFEKKRSQGVRKLWHNLPLLMLLITIVIMVWWMLFCMYKPQTETANTHGLFWLIFFSGVIIFELFCIVYVIPSQFMKDYDVVKLKKNEEEILQNFLKKKSELQSELEATENHVKKTQKFATWMQNPEIAIITPEPIWPQYIIGIAKKNEEQFRKLQKQDEELDDNIARYQQNIDFYDQIPEKTFWQYLRSGKWLKKIN